MMTDETTRYYEHYTGAISPERPGIVDSESPEWFEITEAEYIHQMRPETYFNAEWVIDCPACEATGMVSVGVNDELRTCPLCDGEGDIEIGDLIKFVEKNEAESKVSPGPGEPEE